MSGVPISRETLRGLKAEEDEKYRLERISNCVKDLYRCAVGQAKSSTDTVYTYTLPPFPVDRRTGIAVPQPEFHRDNMVDILSELRGLFPDCSVKFTTLIMGEDRKKMYDISTMDEKVLAFIDINKQQKYESIIIDWT